MNFPFYIAKRYAIRFSKNSAINIITSIASLGIVASAMALFVVLSVFSGLRNFSLDFVNATDSDYLLEATTGKTFVVSPEQEDKLVHNDYVLNFSKIAQERVLFFFNDKEQVAYIKGVDENFTKVSAISEHLYVGNWFTENTNDVIVGAEISRKLGMGLFDFNSVLKVYAPKAGKGAIENVEDGFVVSQLNPVGIYNVNEEVDAKYVFCDLELARHLLQIEPNQITTIALQPKKGVTDDKIRTELRAVFGNDVRIKNKIQQNDSLYKMLNTENIAVYLIFTLVIIIALFNLIGALIMMIIDKKGNIKTLYNLGNTISEIRKVFLYQGLLLTVFGGILGIVLGIVLVFVQQHFSVLMITDSLAYPVQFKWINLVLVCATVLILGFLASFIASRSVSQKLIQ